MALNRPTPNTRTYCSPAEAAEYLGCTTRTIRKWIAQGRLTAYRVGARMIRLDVAEVESLARPIVTTGGAA